MQQQQQQIAFSFFFVFLIVSCAYLMENTFVSMCNIPEIEIGYLPAAVFTCVFCFFIFYIPIFIIAVFLLPFLLIPHIAMKSTWIIDM